MSFNVINTADSDKEYVYIDTWGNIFRIGAKQKVNIGSSSQTSVSVTVDYDVAVASVSANDFIANSGATVTFYGTDSSFPLRRAEASLFQNQQK